MDIQFYTTENMGLFWEYCRMLLSTTSPGVLIWFAAVGVGYLISIIVKSFKSGNKDEDEEIEIKHY